MTDTTTIEKPDAATINAEIEAERAKALELAGRKELAVERAGQVNMAATGGVDFTTLKDIHTYAGWLCKAGPMIPPWLQDNHGGMFGICMKAHELGISALALANWSYVVVNKDVPRVSYESQFFHAVIERPNGPLKTRLFWEIVGEGEERRCRVWATFKGEEKPREFLSDTLKNLHPGKNQYGQTKGSPLWDKKPDLQLFYNASRDFARVYCPDVIAGMYARDEIDDNREHFQGPQNAKDVTPTALADVAPKLRDRLTGPQGEGFAGAKALQDIQASIDAARPAESSVIVEAPKSSSKKKSAGATAATPSSDGPGSDESGLNAAASESEQGAAAVAVDKIPEGTKS